MDYLQYAPCKVLAYNKNIQVNFVPLSPAITLADFPTLSDSSTFTKSPILSCVNQDALHYGHSFLFFRYGT